MGMTVEQLLNELEKPENQGEIKRLVHLKNLDSLEELKQMRGVGGLFSKLILSFTKKHMDAFIALSECENAADIAAFKQTKHFDKIRSSEVGEGMELKDLAKLKELQSLDNLNKHFLNDDN